MAVVQRSKSDGTLEFVQPGNGRVVLKIGGPGTAAVSAPQFSVESVIKVPLSNSADTGGAVLSWQNNIGNILITGAVIQTTTKSTQASTIDVGTTTVNGTTSSDNLLDGIDTGTAAGVFSNYENGGSNGKTSQYLANGKWVTASRASGAVAGLVGYAVLKYIAL